MPESTKPWGVLDSLKVIGEAEKLKGPREGAYLDTRDRVLDKAHLIVRLRGGLFTVKARSTDLASLTDLQPCTRIKYEQDFFDEVGYSISSEVVFKKEEWLEDPTKASAKDVMAFLQAKCPALGSQLEPILKPLQSLVAPGVARMYSAEFKLNHPLAARLKEANVAAWLFPGSPHTLVEVAWTGLVSDKAALDRMYYEVRDKLANAGLLTPDQSSKTEQYFKAFLARPRSKRTGTACPIGGRKRGSSAISAGSLPGSRADPCRRHCRQLTCCRSRRVLCGHRAEHMVLFDRPGALGQEPGDVWGGLAAMLVALPAAIGFGVTVIAAIGPGIRGARRACRHRRRDASSGWWPRRWAAPTG